ncbi:unnamed protein product, partial [marine sediment metagenome]
MSEWVRDDKRKEYFAYDFIRKLGLSVHAFITPGGIIIRGREDLQGAYHAKGYNKNSLGVELLVNGVHNYPGFLDRIKTDYVPRTQWIAAIALV